MWYDVSLPPRVVDVALTYLIDKELREIMKIDEYVKKLRRENEDQRLMIDALRANRDEWRDVASAFDSKIAKHRRLSKLIVETVNRYVEEDD